MNQLAKKILLVGVLIVSGVESQSSDVVLKCGANQVFTDCGSGCGDLKCGEKPLTICAAICFKGCMCAKGYVRDSTNNCVLPRECPAVCPPKEHLSPCLKPCEPTCKNPIFNQMCRPSCNNETIPQCICNDGYVRNTDDKCVKTEECCSGHMAYTTCGSACQATCDNPYLKYEACTLQCVIGCMCKDGFVKNKYGVCIPVEACSSADCGKNQEYLPSGSPCLPACDSSPSINFLCVENRAGCFCKKGFVKYSTSEPSRCILKKNCPVKCAVDEVWNECGPSYGSLTCNSYRSPPISNKRCYRGCLCKDGYVKNLNGTCILISNCPANV